MKERAKRPVLLYDFAALRIALLGWAIDVVYVDQQVVLVLDEVLYTLHNIALFKRNLVGY